MGLDSFYIVGWQHASLACSLDGAIHPAFINGLYVYNCVTIFEGNLIRISCHIVIHGSVGLLSGVRKGGEKGARKGDMFIALLSALMDIVGEKM